MIWRFLSMAVLLLVLPASPALADGKFFGVEEVPPDLPYQRAFLVFDGKSEILILQSKYDFGAEGAVTDFGWVVPVPAVPRLVDIDSFQNWVFFREADGLTGPRWIPLGRLAILGLLVAVAIWIIRLPPGIRRRKFSILFVSVVVPFLLLSMLLSISGEDCPGGVEVLSTERVGIYEVRIIRAEAGGGLVEWLREEGFAYGPADEAALDDYVERGWCFVVARVAPGEDEWDEEGSREGLCAPLVLDFPTDEAVYPLALTGTAGTETEVLLYVLARHQVECGDRLETLRSRPVPEGILPPWGPYGEHGCEEPSDGDTRWQLPWLTKLKGRLTPEEMREDLTFHFAETDEEVQTTVLRWW